MSPGFMQGFGPGQQFEVTLRRKAKPRLAHLRLVLGTHGGHSTSKLVILLQSGAHAVHKATSTELLQEVRVLELRGKFLLSK